MPRRSSYPRSLWIRAVADLGSGESVRSVAQRYGVGAAGLSYWRRKLREEAAFVPVVVSGGAEPATGGGVLDLAVDGVVVRFREDTSPQYVARLVAALRSK